MPCAHCEPYAQHFQVRGLCTVRWRGKSFDADQALGNVGLALMRALGYPTSGFVDFSKRVRVTPFRDGDARAPPSNEGEWWDFHVALREGLDAHTLARAKEAARRALERSRNFASAELVEAAP